MATTKKSSKSSSTSGGAARADKSVEAFRDALERSVTLSRERIQEVADDAVDRGRMTRKDANELVSNLVVRGRQQSEELLKELETLIARVQREVEGRATDVRKRAGKAADKAMRKARDAADQPLAQVDEIRRRAGVGSFPISGYDELTAAQIKSRLAKLEPADLRKVRDYEKKNKARKGILGDIQKRLS